MGEVIEVGDGVDKVQGRRPRRPAVQRGLRALQELRARLTNYCLTAQPKPEWAGAAYGFADMGPWPGGQAELLRVPWGDFNCLRLGEDADEKADRLRDAGRHLADRLPRHRAGRRLSPATRPSSTAPARSG